jgi:hypothetical protein
VFVDKVSLKPGLYLLAACRIKITQRSRFDQFALSSKQMCEFEDKMSLTQGLYLLTASMIKITHNPSQFDQFALSSKQRV